MVIPYVKQRPDAQCARAGSGAGQRRTWEALSPFYVPMRFDQDTDDNFVKVWLCGMNLPWSHRSQAEYKDPVRGAVVAVRNKEDAA